MIEKIFPKGFSMILSASWDLDEVIVLNLLMFELARPHLFYFLKLDGGLEAIVVAGTISTGDVFVRFLLR